MLPPGMVAGMIDLRHQGYELLDKLGEGGTGTVYRARQLSLDRFVAIKLLPPRPDQARDTIERFLIEARIAAALKHPNIVQVYEAGQCGDNYFFVMELVSGYSVADWLQRKGRIAEEDAMLIIQYVAEALDYAWYTAAILHGDVKPANIMVDGDGTIKLSDFLALTPPGGQQRPESLRTHVVGTPNYMSPEQAQGKDTLDFHTDIYSLGAVLYELLTGQIPFEELAETEKIMRAQISGQLPDPQSLNPGISSGCTWLIEKMLVKDPAQRYVSWTEVREDIRRVKHGGFPADPLPAADAGTIERSPERERRRIIRLKALRDGLTEEEALRAARRRRRRLVATPLLLMALLAAAWAVSRHSDHIRPLVDRTWRKTIEYLARTLEDDADPSPPPAEPPHPMPGPVKPAPLPEPEPPPPERPLPHAEEKIPAPADVERITDSIEEIADDLEHWRIEYWRLFGRIAPLIRRRDLEDAALILQDAREQAEDPRLAEACEREIERIRRIQALLLLPLTHRDALIGQTIQLDNHAGIIADIRGDTLLLSRVAGTGAQAQLSLSLESLSDEARLRLVRAAAPDHTHLHEAIWLLTRFDFERATRTARGIFGQQDYDELTRWAEEWHSNLANLRALEALEHLRETVREQPREKAREQLHQALETFGQSDVFRHLYARDIERLRTELDALPAAAPAAPPPPAYRW